MTPTTGFGRDIAFDAAGNIHSVSSGQGLLRVYSPGGFTMATTGSEGTFTLDRPEISVSVAATQPLAAEAGPVAAVFTFMRSGGESTNLTVAYSVGGTAANGVDYPTLAGSIVIPAGTNAATLTVTPVDESEAEFTETVVITLPGSPQYSPATPATATAVIVDNETPEISITALETNLYERVAADYVRFRLTRRGETNVPPFFVNLSYAGSATPNADYTSTSGTWVDPGIVSVNVTLNPLDDSAVEGNESILVGVATGSGYVVGSPGSATATLVDDDLPAETILFADDFETDTSGNWTVTFGALNNIDDKQVLFN